MNKNHWFLTIVITMFVNSILSGCVPSSDATSEPDNNTSVPEIVSSPLPSVTIEATFTPDVFPTLIASFPEEIVDAKGITMRLVPAGEFTMGSDFLISEKPIHTIYLDSYYIDVYEVTNQAYRECVDAGACRAPSTKSSATHTDYFNNPEFSNYPVIYVTWINANSYCQWRGAHLPTEAEWEKAARGTDERLYPWGNDFGCTYANMVIQGAQCVGDTTAVGSYELGISPYGLYDMAGNVAEWTSSILKPYPYTVNDGRESQKAKDPHIVRGGTWYYADETFSRTTKRDPLESLRQDQDIGFRCAR